MLKVILCIISLLYLVSCPAPSVDNVTMPPVVEEGGNSGESGGEQETEKPEIPGWKPEELKYYYSKIFYHPFKLFDPFEYEPTYTKYCYDYIYYISDQKLAGSMERPLDVYYYSGINFVERVTQLKIACASYDSPITDHLYEVSFTGGKPGENGYTYLSSIGAEAEVYTENHLEGNIIRFKTRASDQYFWVKIDMKDRNTFHATYYKTGWYPGDYDESKFPTQYIVFRRM